MALEIPLVVIHTLSLFQVLHTDTVHISPVLNSYKYVAYKRYKLSLWIEAKALKQEGSKAIRQWLFEDVICRYGSLVKIVMDNRTPFKKAMG